LGELQTHMRIHTEELGRQTDMLFEIRHTLQGFPDSLLTMKTPSPASTDHDMDGLRAIVPILKALLPLATLAMLAAGRITWADIPQIIGLGGP
jgi:hypothetical protein